MTASSGQRSAGEAIIGGPLFLAPSFTNIIKYLFLKGILHFRGVVMAKLDGGQCFLRGACG